jgi:hypothetical protein
MMAVELTIPLARPAPASHVPLRIIDVIEGRGEGPV